MDRVLNEFVAILRRHGLRASPAETLDALHALSRIGLRDRTDVKAALRATLCKTSADIETFDRLFELYFTLSAAAPDPAAGHGHGHGHGHERDEQLPDKLEADVEGQAQPGRSDDHGEATPELRRFFDKDRLRQTPGVGHDDSNRLRLSLFAEQLMLNRRNDALDRVLRRVTQNIQVRRARNLLTPGPVSLADGNGEELPLDVSAAEIQELVDELHELDVDPELIAELESQADAIRAQLPALIAALLARRKALDSGLDPGVMERSLVKVAAFAEPDRRQLEAAIRRLARQLHGETSRRRRAGTRGQISIPHTLRRNLRYDGIPFEPVYRHRRVQKPKLVIICDVSLSTRNLSRFWLQLVYQLQDLFAKVRTFVFVADLVEVTDVFREQRFEPAVEKVFAGGLLDVDVNSDFGKAIGQFTDRHLDTIGRRTTVVVLGDARNNGKPANERALRDVAQLARRVIWMTPEPRWGWPLGSCDMDRYEPLCDRVEVVRTVEQLADVAENLVHEVRAPSLLVRGGMGDRPRDRR